MDRPNPNMSIPHCANVQWEEVMKANYKMTVAAVGGGVFVGGRVMVLDNPHTLWQKIIFAPRQYAHRCLRAGGQERSQAWCESLHRRGDQAARWNAASSRVAGRSGWSNAAYVIAVRARSLE